MVSRQGFHRASPTSTTMIAAKTTKMIDSGRRDGRSRRAFAMRAILPSPANGWSPVWMGSPHRSVWNAVLHELRPADLEPEPLVERGQVALRGQLVRRVRSSL